MNDPGNDPLILISEALIENENLMLVYNNTDTLLEAYANPPQEFKEEMDEDEEQRRRF